MAATLKARVERNQSEMEREQATETARLKRQLADQAEELAIGKRRRRTSPRACSEVRIRAREFRHFPDHLDVPGVGGIAQRLLRIAGSSGPPFGASTLAQHVGRTRE